MNTKVTIQEVANWQLNYQSSEVTLPTLQRGFVWKPKQIEDLWDSILRGFPIGSFLFSKTSDNKYLLMDGQQRATSIAAGLCNPFIENPKIGLWSIKGNLPVTWIDIDPSEKPDRNIFLIRVVTRSHPWGYNRKDNSKILSSGDRRKALELFSNGNDKSIKYTDFSNKTIFPFDAYFPIPLAFFFISESENDVIDLCKEHLPNNFSTNHNRFVDKKSFIESLNSSQRGNLAKIFNAVQIAKEASFNYDIIDNSVLIHEEENDPTLFVRINSEGTPLSGDDLIYSIYKAVFPQTKDLVEDIAASFISPILIISLASRIAYSQINNHNYPNKLSVKDFQRNIKIPEFKNALCKLISPTGQEAGLKVIIEQAIEILSQPSKEVKVPAVLVKNIINKSSDIFLFLLYWLFINRECVITEKTKTNVIGAITYYVWFSIDNRKLSRALWTYFDDHTFWHNPLKNEFFNELLYPLIEPVVFREYMLTSKNPTEFNSPSSIGEKVEGFYRELFKQNIIVDRIEELYSGFFSKLFWCKPMILFAQRNYLESEFGEYNQFEDMEDTNVPWDWDHIYPDSWVYRKQYVNEDIRRWVNSIGNFRALSFGQNRSENNLKSPSERLSEELNRTNSFIKDEDWFFWSQITGRIWDENTDNYTSAIKLRMINIYSEWWKSLNIGDIISDTKI